MESDKFLLEKIKNSGIKDLEKINTLNLLDGSYLNLECRLPNGKTGKILDDNKKYYANQIDIEGSDKCFGVAADDNMISVFRYGCNGDDAELILWKKI